VRGRRERGREEMEKGKGKEDKAPLIEISGYATEPYRWVKHMVNTSWCVRGVTQIKRHEIKLSERNWNKLE